MEDSDIVELRSDKSEEKDIPTLTPKGHKQSLTQNPQSPTLKQKATFALSFNFNWMKAGLKVVNHWTRITDQLYLSALPLASAKHHVAIIKECKKNGEDLKLVVSAVNAHEKAGMGLLVSPVSKEKWKKHGKLKESDIENIDCPIEDFSTKINHELMFETVTKMHEVLTADPKNAVLVHCKAGKGRSLITMMCYLTTYGNMEIKEAHLLIKGQRPQIDPLNKIQQTVSEFREYFNTQRELAEVKENTSNVKLSSMTNK